MDQRRTLYALAAVFAGFGGGGAGIGRPRLLPGDDVLAVVGGSAVGSAEEKADAMNVKRPPRWEAFVGGLAWGTYPFLR
ncbi:hypothetical protein EMIT0P100_130011 [Pseudomonas sp. IT-P100]